MMICRHRFWRAALCSLLILLSIFCGANAESGGIMLEIGVEARPDEMVQPEDVTLTFTITNASQTDANNIYLSSLDGLLYEPIGSIAAGDTQTFSRTHSVTQDELNAGIITYIVSLDDPMNADGRINYTIQAPVKRTEAAPHVEFTRQFSSTQVRAGEAVTITYRIRNTGNVALSSLRVQDQLGEYTGRLEYLGVGETRTLINRPVIAEDSASVAKLSYCVSGNERDVHVLPLDDAAISVAKGAISASFGAEYTTLSGTAAKATLQIINSGNTDYRDLTVTDDVNGGVIADHIDLAAGDAPAIVESICPIRGEMELRWRIAGTDSTGENVDFTTETLLLTSVRVNAPSELTVSAQTDTPRIRRDGDVRIQLEIRNLGSADITDAVLVEENTGEARTFAVIPGNGSVRREIIRHVQEDAEFVYTLTYIDTDGWERTAQSQPVQIAIAADGVQPEGVKQSLIEFTGRSIKVGGSELFAWLLIAAVIVLITLIVVLAASSRKARIQREVRMAARRRRHKSEARKTEALKAGSRPRAEKEKKTRKDHV